MTASRLRRSAPLGLALLVVVLSLPPARREDDADAGAQPPQASAPAANGRRV